MHVTWNTVQHGQFSHPLKKDTLFLVEVVSDLAYKFCSCVDIEVNQILKKSGHLVHQHCDCFGGRFKELYIVITQNK